MDVHLLPEPAQLGIGQAVAIRVGQSLGEDRPDRAAQSTWAGLGVAGTYMGALALMYIGLPTLFIAPFQGDNDPVKWHAIAERVVVMGDAGLESAISAMRAGAADYVEPSTTAVELASITRRLISERAIVSSRSWSRASPSYASPSPNVYRVRW